MATKIDLERYAGEVSKGMKVKSMNDLIHKDFLLTLILAEFQKEQGIFRELIFKGGTLLSRNHLNYHRFSEDLDFVHKDSGNLRALTRNARERKIKTFIDLFTPQLKKVADTLGLDFSTNRSDKRYCKILLGRVVYTFRLYYETDKFLKIDINFIEKLINQPKEAFIKVITDFFDSKDLLFTLGLKLDNFKVLSYPIEEIILEKYRALLTRNALAERDLFDLYLIPNSSQVNLQEVVDKIENSLLIKKELSKLISDKMHLLKEGNFFKSREKIEEFAIVEYDKQEFEEFKDKIKPLLIEICQRFLKK